MHLNSRLLFEKYAAKYFTSKSRVLEIGPDTHPSTFQNIAPHHEWHTLDIRTWGPPTYVATSDYTFPVADCSYDVVLSASVIEHVKEVWTWMQEIARVTKPGGRVITICPTSWPYHEAPVDCWRIYPEGMMALYRHAGLEVEECINATLEETGTAFRIPGRSLNYVKDNLRQVYEAAKVTGGPCECAYDTIAIGVKR